MSKLQEMEIHIISSETIKPSSPTPNHLTTHKLSLLDQLAPPIYIPLIFFYNPTNQNQSEVSHHLKNTLSKALTHFYPLAGKIKDPLTVDCNDDGATFVEAQVAGKMSSVLPEDGQPEIDALQKLLPCSSSLHHLTNQPIVAVQINYFACGGMAICACISHVVADTSAAASFVKRWADVACGGDSNGEVVYDFSSLFPPQDLSVFYRVMGLIARNNNVDQLHENDVVMKRFVFDGLKIAALRNEMSDALTSYRPTPVQAVSGLIWEALMAATANNDETTSCSKLEAILNVVNMRRRMKNPSPPQQCIGNVCHLTMVSPLHEDNKVRNRSALARKIYESIKEIDDEYIKKMYIDGECFNLMNQKCEELEKDPKLGVFILSSWCSFPFYEMDFGFGKPVWFGTTMRRNRTGYLIDASDGEGIEAWISLSKKEMATLEQQAGILGYATFSPSI